MIQGLLETHYSSLKLWIFRNYGFFIAGNAFRSIFATTAITSESKGFDILQVMDHSFPFPRFRQFPGAMLLLLPFGTAGAEIHASATAMTENIGKGFSKSAGEFSGLVNFDYQHVAGFYAGVNTAYVNFGDNLHTDAARVEIAPYLGWTFSLSNDWRLDSQWSRYFYDGKIYGETSDYNEFSLFLHFRDMLSAGISFSEDYYQRGHSALNYELTGRYPVTDFLEISSGIGYTQAERALEYDYLYWNAGISAFFKFLTFDLRYVQATATATAVDPGSMDHPDHYPPPLEPTLVFSISAGF
jgi:uncharacterized protein (TIGR02001 family)